jgi:hypothetical protein
MMQKDMVAAAGVLGLGIVIAALIGSLTFYNVRSMDNTLSVTSKPGRTRCASCSYLFFEGRHS